MLFQWFPCFFLRFSVVCLQFSDVFAHLFKGFHDFLWFLNGIFWMFWWFPYSFSMVLWFQKNFGGAHGYIWIAGSRNALTVFCLGLCGSRSCHNGSAGRFTFWWRPATRTELRVDTAMSFRGQYGEHVCQRLIFTGCRFCRWPRQDTDDWWELIIRLVGESMDPHPPTRNSKNVLDCCKILHSCMPGETGANNNCAWHCGVSKAWKIMLFCRPGEGWYR